MSETEQSAPTSEQAREARDEIRQEQQELMDELTEYDHITRFFKNKCFAFADECEQTAAISSLINCDDKFVEAYMVTVGKVYQESRKRVFTHYKNIRTMYLFLTAEENLLDSDGHRINSLVSFIGSMYNGLLKLRSDALTLCEAIRQIKTSQNSSFFPLHKSSSFHRVWRHIAEIMYQFASVDFLAERYPELGTNFLDFQRRIKKQFDKEFTPEQRKAYEEGAKAQEDAQSMILKGMCFRTLYESSGGDMDNNQGFASEMKDAIAELLEGFEKSCNQGTIDGRMFCGISALTVYYYHHFSNFADHSIIRKVVQASKKVPYYRLLGEELFVPAEFLRRQISNNKIFDAKMEAIVKKMDADAKNFTSERVAEMLKELKEYIGYAKTWIKEFTEKKRDQTTSITKLPQWGLDISELFLKCIRLLETITRNLYLIVRAKRGNTKEFKNLSDLRRLEIDRGSAWAILSAIETAKKLEMFVMDNWSTVEEGSFLARQQWRKHLLRILSEAKKAYSAARTKNTNPIETSTKKSFYHIAEAQCCNEMIPSRNVVLGLAYEIGRLESHVSSQNRKQVYDLMSRLETFNSPRQLLQRAAYTGFLLAHSWLPDLYFESLIFRKPTDKDMDGFANALGGFMEGARETGQSVFLMSRLKETIQESFVVKVGNYIDVDLRVLANTDLQVGEYEKIPGVDLEYISHLLKHVKKFQVATTMVDYRDAVREYLEEHWYSMQVLAPNSVTTYTKMTDLAKVKYGLFLNDPELPMADTDEKVDLMEMIKNISHFCTNYSYFSQGYLFIEKASASRRLNVVRIEDLKTALRKHGVGLLPTAVNAAYMLIRNKLQTFLNFLSEDTVRFQIQKFLHELEANKSSSDGKKKSQYKVSWAVQVIKNLSRVVAVSEGASGRTVASETASGVSEEEIPYTYFDKFRSIITQIGNAISVVRMLCQAARENGFTRQDLFPQIKKYMDDLEATTRGMILTNRKDHPINHQKVLAAYRLRLVKEMFEKVSEDRNYTKMLCVEFKSLLLNKANLKEDALPVVDYFHGVIPALSISHVNYMMAHENRVKKTFALKHNKDLVVVEDGFAAGCAFLLHVLDGWDSYFKMNWFESYTQMKEHEIRIQSENRTFSQAIQMKIERLQTELKILNNFKMNFGVQHTIFTVN